MTDHQAIAERFATQMNITDTDVQYDVFLEEVQEVVDEYETFGDIDDDALGEEMADVIITLRVLAAVRGIDIDRHYETKMEYNCTKTPKRKDGKVTDDGDKSILQG